MKNDEDIRFLEDSQPLHNQQIMYAALGLLGAIIVLLTILLNS